MRYPSIKALKASLNIDTEKAEAVREIWEANREDICTKYKRARYLDTVCHSPPAILRLRMEALNELLEMSGVEVIEGREGSCGFREVVATYLNAGDIYVPTLLYCHPAGTWRLTDLGSFVESNTRRYGIH